MRLLNPKHALATLLFVFIVYLAMTGRLSDMVKVIKND